MARSIPIRRFLQTPFGDRDITASGSISETVSGGPSEGVLGQDPLEGSREGRGEVRRLRVFANDREADRMDSRGWAVKRWACTVRVQARRVARRAPRAPRSPPRPPSPNNKGYPADGPLWAPGLSGYGVEDPLDVAYPAEATGETRSDPIRTRLLASS